MSLSPTCYSDSILISILGLVPVLIWMLICIISNLQYFVFLRCSIIIAIVISDGCMSGKQAICVDLNKWCIFYIYIYICNSYTTTKCGM